MRDGLLVKNTCHSCKEPRFSSQNPQPSVIPVPRDLSHNSDLLWHQKHTCTCCTNTHACKYSFTYKIKSYEQTNKI